VSHDRVFLDNVITDYIAPAGDGHWIKNPGGYADWKRFSEEQAARKNKSERAVIAREAAAPAKESRTRKMSFKELRELEALPAKIEALEKEQADIARRLADGAVYRSAPDDAKRLNERHAAIDNEVGAAMKRWEELEAAKP
ncbi:MAG TPA: ABC transporter ATP-binding protein, partial [Burkholderiales bacterium]